MKFKVEFEMKYHTCFICPLSDSNDDCNLLKGTEFEGLDEQILHCPLEEIDHG